jgi:uncharacterized protein (DUF58 family)
MLIAVALFLFIGLLNRQHDLVVLCILVLGITSTLKLWSKVAKSRIEYFLTIDRYRIFPGEKIVIAVTVENHKPLPVWLEVKARVDGPSNAFVEPLPARGQQSLLWYQKARFQWQLTALRRGVSQVGPLCVRSADLLDFFEEESESSGRLQVVVYPRIAPLAHFNLPKRDFFGIPGGESPVDDPVYILGTSDYHHGRPAKYIHWKASARHQRLQEKVFDSSEQEKILLLIDTAGYARVGAEEAFERCLEVVASLAVQWDRRGCAIGLLTNGVVSGAPPFVAISRGPGQLSAVLETLARLDIACSEEIVDAVRNAGLIPWGTTCVCLTFREHEGTHVLVEYLKRWKTPVTILTGEMISSLRGSKAAGPEALLPTGTPVPVEEVSPS